VTLLLARRSLFGAEREEVDATSARLISPIRLYKVPGGGWPYQRATTSAS
jgi:outer membrane protein TolC